MKEYGYVIVEEGGVADGVMLLKLLQGFPPDAPMGEVLMLLYQWQRRGHANAALFFNFPDGAKAAARPTTPDEMRTAILDGIDYALTAPLLSRFLSQDAKDELYAQRGYWQDADATQLAAVLAKLPARP